MEVFAIPDVYYKYLWPLLSWSDLLRVRRVCKAAKFGVDDYLKRNLDRIPEFEINENHNSLTRFLKLQTKTRATKLFINNEESGSEWFANLASSYDDFINKHGGNIISLKVHTFGMIPTAKEEEFLQRLGNMTEFKVLNWVPQEQDNSNCDRDTLTRYSLMFRNLTNIEISITNTSYQPATLRRIMLLSSEFADPSLFPNLKSFTLPYISSNLVAEPRQFLTGFPMGVISHYHGFFKELRQRITHTQSDGGSKGARLSALYCLKFYQIVNNEGNDNLELQRVMDRLASNPFMELLQYVSKIEGFKLEMVNASWFGDAYEPLKNNPGHCIKSMVNIHPAAMRFVNLDNLQRLDVISSRSNVLHHRVGEFDTTLEPYRRGSELSTRPAWTDLRSINIVVDSTQLGCTEGYMMMPHGDFDVVRYWEIHLSCLFTFLFHGVTTESLVALSIDFQCNSIWKPTNATVMEIVTSCPNIKKLGLTNWTGTNKSLTKFWDGLLKLEAVTLKSCLAVGNVAFFGSDVENPVFLRLNNLKTLSLLDLDTMPKISDTLFRRVLSQMSLSQLYITSQTPCQNITASGIRSLLSGKFADCIQKFPFSGWSILSCSDQEFGNMAKDFRSSNMI